jgi:hypothetical protein
MFGDKVKILLDENQAGGGAAGSGGQQQNNQQGNQGQQQGGQQEQTFENFEAFLAKQPEGVRKLYETHTTGLKSALQGERDNNKKLEKDLRDAASKAEKGSENEKKLIAMADEISKANLKATFYEGAVEAGISNIKLAFVAAKEDDLFKKDGSVDWDALKKSYPELFGSSASNDAGAGSRSQNTSPSMDDIIRKKSGAQ